METVTQIFARDHKRIAQLIYDLELETATAKSVEKLSALRFSLEKHFAEEEKMYEHMRIERGKKIPVMDSIIKQHKEILDKIRHAEKQWAKGFAIDITDTITILKKHSNTEEKLLYPELDKGLTEEEKEQVFWDIKAKWENA